MDWKCVQKKCSTRNASPNMLKHGFVNVTSFYINQNILVLTFETHTSYTLSILVTINDVLQIWNVSVCWLRNEMSYICVTNIFTNKIIKSICGISVVRSILASVMDFRTTFSFPSTKSKLCTFNPKHIDWGSLGRAYSNRA